MVRAIMLAFTVLAAPAMARPASPKAALDELLATESRLSEAAQAVPPADGIGSMLAEDGVLYTRQGPVRGRSAAIANLAANPNNAGAHASWRTVRGGVSADGQHGFTLGYLDVDGAPPAAAHRRYLAYWVHGAGGWRAAALKQVVRSAGEVDEPAQPPAMPVQTAANPRKWAAYKASLVAAERAFSDRAQIVGIYQSFQEKGRPDAIHIFGEKGFAIGLKAIGAAQAKDTAPATISWSADDAIVSPSGDLGVTFGIIRANDPKDTGTIPFFTVWRRDGPAKPWRYIAE